MQSFENCLPKGYKLKVNDYETSLKTSIMVQVRTLTPVWNQVLKVHKFFSGTHVRIQTTRVVVFDFEHTPLTCMKHTNSITSCCCITGKVELLLWMGLYRQMQSFENCLPKGYKPKVNDYEMSLKTSKMVQMRTLTPVWNQVLKVHKLVSGTQDRIQTSPPIVMVKMFDTEHTVLRCDRLAADRKENICLSLLHSLYTLPICGYCLLPDYVETRLLQNPERTDWSRINILQLEFDVQRREEP
ncbi:hypothetical protein PYW07_000166 [Mythimna separata]|uniref:C2 domain-containing protein n=1 Tax=Mythimna separata TaxID=271217 RepID=A0AAD7Z3E6_MYTSE|nr:hypothetical protein PYW07_000166 [Mythimna separata]